MSEKEILKRLLVDETEVLRTLVTKAEKLVRIDKTTGAPIIMAPRTKLSDRELIGLYLLGRYFAVKLELSKTDSATVSELSDRLGIGEKSVTGRASELKRERLVESVGRGEYRIVAANVERLVDDISAKIPT